MTDLSVVAVVVTYNRKNLLVQTLAALARQTQLVAKIIVVDNASTDGTDALMTQACPIDLATVDYVRLSENTGGAGGFSEGMARAAATGADWIWAMDDDVAPTPDCLSVLLRYREASECIVPRKFFPDGTEYQNEQFHDVLTGGRYGINNLSFRNGKPLIFNNTATFEGLLISRRLLETIGVPDKKYFISDDDMLFALKASVHTNIAHVRDAIIYRLLNTSDIAPWKSYYFIRNRFFLYRDACEYLEMNPHFSERTKFAVLQLIELCRILAKGRSFFRPAISGFVEGLRYMRGSV